jgi:hypothetical protein
MFGATHSRRKLLRTVGPSPFSAGQVFVFFLGVLSLCYIAALVTPYALADDYTNLVAVQSGAKWPRDLRVAGGRPVHALLNDLFFRCTPDIGGLRYVRLVAVIIVALLALCLYQAMLSTGWDWRHSVMMSLIAVTLPPFQVYASWAETASYPLAAVTAAAAFYAAEVSLRARGTGQKWGLGTGSVLLMLLALTNFQPGAMCFWVFGAIVIFEPGATTAFALRRLLWYGGIVTAAVVLGFCVYKLGMAEYGSLQISARTHLTSNAAGKALWFVQSPLTDALNLVWISPNPWVAVGVATFVSGGMLLYFEGSVGERLCKYFIALSLLPLSYLPNLVIAEDWASYRTQIALTPMILLYSFFALYGCTKVLHNNIADQALISILSLFAVISGLFAAYNVQTYFAIPLSVELRLMRNQIRTGNLAQARSIYVIGSTWRDSIAPAVRYEEFGLPFSAQPWSPGPAVYLALRDLDPARSSIPIEVAPICGPIKPPPDALVVDMRKLRDFR